MDNQEALNRISKSNECYVIWDTINNEIVCIGDASRLTIAKYRAEDYVEIKNSTNNPKKIRFFKSSQVTLEILEAEQKETLRNDDRAIIYRSLEFLSTEELVTLLVTDGINDSIGLYHGGNHIITMLYRFRFREISSELMRKLEQFAQSQTCVNVRCKLSPEDWICNINWGDRVKLAVECYLCGLKNEKEKLIKLWDTKVKYEPIDLNCKYWEVFGDLGLSDKQIINELFECVENPISHSPWREALVTLGKLGPACGNKAADVIKENIKKDDVWPNCIFDRIISHITSESVWDNCSNCYRGLLPNYLSSIPSSQICPICLGLGKV